MSNENFYDEIVSEYPQFISLNQMYKICHISKRKGTYLLQNGIIPCEDTGKQTRRYTIKTKDVVQYLKNIDENPNYYNLPHIFSSNYSSHSCHKRKQSYTTNLNYVQKRIIELGFVSLDEFIEYCVFDIPDVLNAKQIAELLKCTNSTAIRWIKKGKISSISFKNKVVVPKEYFLEFLKTEYNKK